MIQEKEIKNKGDKMIQEFLKGSEFQKTMAGADKYLAIFICTLKPKTTKKIGTSLTKANDFLDQVGKENIAKICPYLLDETNRFKILKSEPGFNIPVLKDSLRDLLDILNKANEEKKLGFFIDISHKSPYSDDHFVKVQFKNIPPDVDIDSAKIIFDKFGEIKNINFKDGIWTLLYQSINWFLPYVYQMHINTGSKNRWFSLNNALVSFSSKNPCSKCKVKGHSELTCPGESLIKMLKEKQENKELPRAPSAPKKKKEDSSSEDDSTSEENKSSTKNKTKKTPKKPTSKENKVKPKTFKGTKKKDK